MYRVYKPKGLFRIKAVQVTVEKAGEIANNLSGRVTGDTQVRNELGHIVPTGIKVPTMDGVLEVPLNSWIVRKEDNSFEVMSNEDFEAKYEVAVNRTS